MATAYQLALDDEWNELKKLYRDQQSFALSFPQKVAGDTPFHLAVFSKSKEPLQSFLEIAKEDPMVYSAKNIYGNTALHEAAADGNIEAVKLLGEHDKKLLEIRNKKCQTPLFKAAAYGQTEVVHYLAGKGCTTHIDIHRERIQPVISILLAAIQGENFETALELPKLDESLATLEDGNGMTSLELLM